MTGKIANLLREYKSRITLGKLLDVQIFCTKFIEKCCNFYIIKMLFPLRDVRIRDVFLTALHNIL